MSKSIYEEAIKVITYLQYQRTHLKGNRVSIYFPKKDIETLENLLINSQKQEKLLELYKELSNYVDEQTYAHELPEIILLKIKIMELEK